MTKFDDMEIEKLAETQKPPKMGWIIFLAKNPGRSDLDFSCFLG